MNDEVNWTFTSACVALMQMCGLACSSNKPVHNPLVFTFRAFNCPKTYRNKDKYALAPTETNKDTFKHFYL